MPLDETDSALVATVPTGLFIGGGQRDSTDGAHLEIEDPATGEVFATVADATAEDGAAALTAAATAQASWAATAPRERGEILRTAFELLIRRAEDFARLITLEMGKPLAEARGEVAYAAEYLRWFGEEAVRIGGRSALAPGGTSRILTVRQPVGPTLMITPWNFPLAMGTRKIGPALAAGCTMVVKPAPQTPLTMAALAQLFADVGLPAGVLNVVPTTRSSALVEPLLRDGRLRKLTFTGSTPVGRLLVEQSASRLLRVSMELGGNAPFLVFDDADLDDAVDGALAAKMRNAGQACTAANRFLVHESLAETFATTLATRMSQMIVGRGTKEGVTVGPLIDAAARAKVDALVGDAVAKGAVVHCGAKIPGGDGYFYSPTVLTGVPAHSAVSTTEIFGPVAAVTTFGTEEEAIALANATGYGLAAYLYSRDLDRVVRVGEALEFGMIGVNRGTVSEPAAPFGGMKESGFGREGGSEGIDEYLETKYLGMAV